MRKLLLVTFGFICCLFFTDRGGSCVVGEVFPQAQLCVDRATDNQWLCEQEYNSNLNLLRVCGETTVLPAPSVARGMISDTGRTTAARVAAILHVWGTSKETSYQKPFNPVSGPNAVDYYVYMLRRIII